MLIQQGEDLLDAATAQEASLVPRFANQGYSDDAMSARRKWIEAKTGTRFAHVAAFSVPGEQMRGNIENPVGVAQVPLGIAGPLLVHGSHAKGIFYVPMATTEGALVRSYERGMMTLTRAGGVTARVYVDENRISPVFLLPNVAAAYDFAASLDGCFARIKEEAESTTRHGKLLRLEPQPVGREVIVNFCYFTADAHGMNMIVKATERACRWMMLNTAATDFYLFSGHSSEKRGSGALLPGGKGKKTVAGAHISRALLRQYLHVTPAQLVDLWRHTMIGHLQANAIGYNGHYANGLAALFIACGQDVANIVNSAVGITNFELTGDDAVYASVTLPSLTVATVGGGTALGTSQECLRMLGVAGPAGAPKLAEIAAATLLAGEISMAAAIASGEFVNAHENYGRNRPES
ncbi:MAG TPA: hydroxymethylglutaryl-CoA reductase [Candidatus Angelobacter sp.]|nr:hydroxymethylglutaryl-CoA reductase [Candidatus Angelobacter sp.]